MEWFGSNSACVFVCGGLVFLVLFRLELKVLIAEAQSQ